MSSDPLTVAFVCVQNAGRSQMSAAFATREIERRGLEDRIEIHTGGTDPADHVHEVVIEAMEEVGFDLSDRTPREITPEELTDCDYVATMGCSTLELGIDGSTVDVREWAFPDPADQELAQVREIRALVKERIGDLFDEIEAELLERERAT